MIETAIYRYEGPNKSNNDRETIIDTETALWSARMIVGEGGYKCSEKKAAAMLWALMNRWFLHPARRHWPSYLYLMRRFSQPINPKWQRGGTLARKWINTKYTTEAKLKRREKISSLKTREIPDSINKMVEKFQAGSLQIPESVLTLEKPRISNWASHKGLNEKYPWGIKLEGGKSYDWFFEDKNLIKGNVITDIFTME
jgi:hypothetical protein